MGIAVMKGLRFADTQESCFEVWKRSYMGFSALLCGLFADCQKWHFQAAKRSDKSSNSLQEGQFDDAWE